jgi:hypothetical protein
MKRHATVGLQTAITDLREISRRLAGILPGIVAGPLRDDLEMMRTQTDAAIAYYGSLLPSESPASAPGLAISLRAAEAAVVPIGGVGLVLPAIEPNTFLAAPQTDE